MVDAWKHEDLPQKQLELNKQELAGRYPDHWKAMLTCLRRIPLNNIVFYDIGCGVGSTCQLLRQEGIQCRYIGIDFSEPMIRIAKRAWNHDEFYVDDYRTSSRDFTDGLLYCNGLLDIVPDGVHELKKLLSLGAKYLILNRIHLGQTSNLRTYMAYNTINCFDYTFSINDFLKTIEESGYVILHREGSCFLVHRK